MTTKQQGQYVAFLRGIGPGNPNMTNDKLCSVFEALGYQDVRSVISSGNIIFSAPDQSAVQLEATIQQALQDRLGIAGGTIIRTADELRAFVARRPYGTAAHSPTTYLLVTFIKDRSRPLAKIAPLAGAKSRVVTYDNEIHALYAVIDTTTLKTPDLMMSQQKTFGKDITSRTWKTIERIIAKL